jgi:hypothetical protein
MHGRIVGFGVCGFVRHLSGSWFGIKQTPDLCDPVSAYTVREETSVADTMKATHRMPQVARREKQVALLQTIPDIGPITASAIVATIGSGKQFSTGRDFAAWLDLTPLNRSSGGKERLGRIQNGGPVHSTITRHWYHVPYLMRTAPF